MLATHQSATSVSCISVCEIGGFAIDGNPAIGFIPAHDAVVGYITPEQATRITKPHRPLTPAAARGQAFNSCQWQFVFVESRVQRDDCRVRISCCWLPAAWCRMGSSHSQWRFDSSYRPVVISRRYVPSSVKKQATYRMQSTSLHNAGSCVVWFRVWVFQAFSANASSPRHDKLLDAILTSVQICQFTNQDHATQ